jgi:hypothetical protein
VPIDTKVNTSRMLKNLRNYRDEPVFFFRFITDLQGWAETQSKEDFAFFVVAQNAVFYSIGVLPVPRNAILPGMTRLTSVPESTELTIFSLPPMRAARSRMPCKP